MGVWSAVATGAAGDGGGDVAALDGLADTTTASEDVAEAAGATDAPGVTDGLRLGDGGAGVGALVAAGRAVGLGVGFGVGLGVGFGVDRAVGSGVAVPDRTMIVPDIRLGWTMQK